jgi:hypothetical protein
MKHVRRASRVPRRRLYAALTILALAGLAATVAFASGGSARTAASVRVVAATADGCGYPSGTGKTATVFNESTTLQGFRVGLTTAGDSKNVQVYYSDEHALTLGQGPTTFAGEYPKPGTTSPLIAGDAATDTSGGDPAYPPLLSVGNTAAVDPAGRPIYPSLFITDNGTGTSANGANGGDWQNSANNNGAQIPNDVYGTWKSFTPGVTVADPAKNGFVLGPNADPVPSTVANLGYVSEVRWDVSKLKDASGAALSPGHWYRVQEMVHDGDQNKAGGDVGEACTTVFIPKSPSTTNTTPNVKITDNINLQVSTSTNASASVQTGDTVTVKLYQSVPTAADPSTGCLSSNQNGGTGATQRGNTKTITINTGTGGNFDPATGTLTAQLTYPDDFGGSSAPALTNGKYWWFVSYSGNSAVTGSNDDCTETFALNSSLLGAQP